MNKKSLLAGNMKTFAKRAAITCGILLTALICMGIIYIDSTQNYWYVNGGFVKLIVSNQTAQAVMTVDTNTQAVGFFTNNIARSFVVKGRRPATVATGNGTSAATIGGILLEGGNGGITDSANNVSGGIGGAITLTGGVAGTPTSIITNATGGAGGAMTITSGPGGNPGTTATNQAQGGAGGALVVTSGLGFSPTTAATNTIGGNGGAVTFSSLSGGTPTGGWTRQGGNGGAFALSSGSGGNSTRTNGGNGANLTVTAGNGGQALTTPGNSGVPGNVSFTAGSSGTAAAGGNPSPGGTVNFTGGAGSTGDTNSDGGHIYLRGGNPGSTANAGNTYIGRNSAGSARGGLVIGLGEGAVTNVLFVRTNLDFPSTLAQTDFDIPVATLGGRTNAIVNVGPPVPAILTGSAWSGFCSNGTVFVRFSVYGLAAKDPGIGDFEVEMKLYQ